MHRMLAAFCALVLTACASARATPAPGELSAEAVREDLATLYAGLQSGHYDLYAITPREEYERLYQQTRRSIDRPMTALEAQVLLQRFTAAGHVAHATIGFPDAAFGAFRQNGGRMFPLVVTIEGGRLIVSRNLSGEAAINAGDEITQINGRAAAYWLERVGRNVSADTDYLAHAQIAPRFGALLWLELGEVATFEVTLRRADGSAASLTLTARSRPEMQAADAAAPPGLDLDYTQRIARLLPNGVAYLRPGIFLNLDSEDNYDTRAFHAFIDSAFEQFIAAGARDLLIDLRGNPGGDNSFSDHMIAWFADEPFRFASAFRIRVSPESTASNQARLAASPPGSISHQFAAAYATANAGDIIDFPIAFAQPRGGARFAGRVFVLIDRGSYSNSVLVAAIVQDYGFGRILGEPTSDLATTYGAAEHFTLPNTGLRVGFPKAHIIRPNGDETIQGVSPDVMLDFPAAPSADDPTLAQALRIIANDTN